MNRTASAVMPDFCNRRHPIHFSTALNLLRISGVDLNQVYFLAVGEYENYRGEIREQDPAPGTALGPQTRVTLKIGFFSAVDRMPYQFFYGLIGRPAGHDWELHARELMAPYDATVIRHDALARYMALKYCAFGIDPEHLSQYLSLFNFTPDNWGLEPQEALVWACLLPSFHDWAGNPDRVASILEFFLGCRFRIIENVTAEYPIPPEIQYRMGSISGRLGCETVAGMSFAECDSTYQVVVTDVPHEQVVHYLPGGVKRKRLEWLLDICMPSHLERAITIETDSKTMVLGRGDQGGYLGYSTCL